MKTKHLFVVIPSLEAAGPTKGAIALCNRIADEREVTIIPLKSVQNKPRLSIDPKLKVVSLERLSWGQKIAAYQKMLKRNGKRDNNVSLSLCFSADFLNCFMAPYAVIVSSVRGNLPYNYKHEHGLKGLIASYVHMMLLHRYDFVIAMTHAMEQQLNAFGLCRIVKIGNFIDESNLDRYRLPQRERSSDIRFVFVGRLSPIKRPELLIETIHELEMKNVYCFLDIVGDGPLMETLVSRTKRLGLSLRVTFHGHLANPYEVLQNADCMVLPSESEGVSRAVLEALFFNIPCIVRDVDGNSELITSGFNGDLFSKDEDLVDVMHKMAQDIEKQKYGHNLLPLAFRQEHNIRRFLEVALQ